MPDSHEKPNIIEESDIPLGYEFVADCGPNRDEAVRLAERIAEQQPAVPVRLGFGKRHYAVFSQRDADWPR